MDKNESADCDKTSENIPELPVGFEDLLYEEWVERRRDSSASSAL
jgi:hypothetical protein